MRNYINFIEYHTFLRGGERGIRISVFRPYNVPFSVFEEIDSPFFRILGSIRIWKNTLIQSVVRVWSFYDPSFRISMIACLCLCLFMSVLVFLPLSGRVVECPLSVRVCTLDESIGD